MKTLRQVPLFKRLLAMALCWATLTLPAQAAFTFSPTDILVRCTPDPTRSAYINQAFGAYVIEFKVRSSGSNLPAQVQTIDQVHYDLDFPSLPPHKKEFDSVYTSRLLNRNLTPHDEALQDTQFKARLRQQEQVLMQTNPLILNGLHFVSLSATMNDKPISPQLRNKTADWVLDKDYLADTDIEQRHQLLFQGSSFLIPLVGVLAAAGNRSSTLIISAIGYIGIGGGIAVLQNIIYRHHRERAALEAINNYDGDFHVDPWSSITPMADENGYFNYRASTLVVNNINKPVLDFRIKDAETGKPLKLHYALTCDGAFEMPKSGEPIEDFKRLFP